jgi:hypothetical protein
MGRMPEPAFDTDHGRHADTFATVA